MQGHLDVALLPMACRDGSTVVVPSSVRASREATYSFTGRRGCRSWQEERPFLCEGTGHDPPSPRRGRREARELQESIAVVEMALGVMSGEADEAKAAAVAVEAELAG